jgi:hypothetical protein
MKSYDARGERRLLVAVLRDAIETLARTATALDLEARRSFAEADEWLRSTDGAFSFAGICAALGVDADRLRSKIRALVAARRRPPVAAPAAARPAPAQRRIRR